MSGFGNTRTQGAPPYRGEPLRKCPITGLWFHQTDGIWTRGMLVHPDAADALGFREAPKLLDGPPPYTFQRPSRRPLTNEWL